MNTRFSHLWATLTPARGRELFRRTLRRTLAVSSLALALIGSSPARQPTLTAAEPDDVARRVAAHIEAGEFGPARVLAQAVPGQNDALMAQLAAAQARAGARGGFANAWRGIGNDQVRSGVANPFSNGGFVGGQNGFGMPGLGNGAGGGAAMADFQSLIDLIQKTTGNPKPGWEADGGVGRVEQFPQGVLVDAKGFMTKATTRATDSKLNNVRTQAATADGNRDVRQETALRKVSLTRLERELQLARLLGQPTDPAMRNLAGLRKIQYVLIYPETGDLVVAGPAGDWSTNEEGRSLSVTTSQPILQLDDLIVLLRNATEGDAVFGCSINPRNENLAQLKQFVEATTKKPLQPSQREGWVQRQREIVGAQDIVVFGIDPRTRVARTIVEADYRMKLVGMGLEPGVLGVDSYLDSIQVGKDGRLPALDVLRWWFTLNYDALQASESRDAFELQGQGVKVLSENELLTQRGERVHTGQAEELNRQFAASFTKHFPALAAKYPVYGELRNVFDLALVASLIRSQDLAGQVGWHMSYLGNPEQCPVELGHAPKLVDSIVNHKVINGKHVVVGVSGGVSADARGLVKGDKIKTDSYGKLQANRAGAAPKNVPADGWWWD